jgi:CelD/BcsL family acetyltransferase involved in cellulose biosynthesis
MEPAPVTVRRLDGFADPALPSRAWNGLLRTGDSDLVFLTWEWQTAWWECFGRGQLLLLAAAREGQTVALAPLFADGGMVFFTGSGAADYLDFVGDVSEPAVLDALLQAARAAAPEFVGFRFYHVPDASRTSAQLQAAAARLGLAIFDEGHLPAPTLDLVADRKAALAATQKSSVLRDERALGRDGELAVRHFRTAAEVRPQLDVFFQQHVARRAASGQESKFLQPAYRAFYRQLAERGAAAGWLRFSRMDWQGRPAAFHFGSCHQGRFLYSIPTFAQALARRSPGSVLLRHLLLAALDEGAAWFDFGLGDESYKQRYATQVTTVRTWGLYPPEVLQKATP